jgi:hypothetical protein
MARSALSGAFERALGPTDADGAARIAAMTATVMSFLARAQAILRVAGDVQARTARLLHRPPPARAVTLADLNLHNLLMADDVRTLPFLPDEIGAVFGLDIQVDAESIAITDLGAAPAARSVPHSIDALSIE